MYPGRIAGSIFDEMPLPTPAPGATTADRSIDLRGERCPYTFIKARLALEEMGPGEILAVTLDFRPAFARVPASLAVLGHSQIWEEAERGGTKRFGFRRGSLEPEGRTE